MKINFRNPVSDEIIESGINMVCDNDMNIIISADDYNRLADEFPAAFDDVYVVEHEIEDVELLKGKYGHDTLSWVLDGKVQSSTGEFMVKDGYLYHTAIAANGDEVEIKIKY